ncbi:MAG: S8 family peptidase [Elusimicrobia bacterium]|nr:S8 family peptidase [Elusimicrobiota bacterium]
MIRAERLALILALGLLAPAVAGAKTCPVDTGKLRRHIVSCQPEQSMAQCRKAVESISCSITRELALINAVVITVPEDELEATETKLAATPEVRAYEEDKYVKWIKAEAPVLPSFGFSSVPAFVPSGKSRNPIDPPSAHPTQPNANGQLPWGIARVNAPAAWKTNMGAGVKVAVVDTGIDYNHAALKANVKGGFNAVDEKNPDNFMDDQGHGSHVSGTIAGAYNNGQGAGGSGVIGVAPKASLYGVKVLDADGGGSYSTIIAGIEWAVKNKMQVANMSLGAPEGTDALHQAIIAAKKAGLVILAAAGNDSGGPTGYPAAYPETISITASNDKDEFASFSSKGPETNFIAPGEDVLSVKLGGGYIVHSGTSMATPHMTGLAALAVANGARGFTGVKNALIKAAAKLPGLTAEEQGYGLVSAAKLAK